MKLKRYSMLNQTHQKVASQLRALERSSKTAAPRYFTDGQKMSRSQAALDEAFKEILAPSKVSSAGRPGDDSEIKAILGRD